MPSSHILARVHAILARRVVRFALVGAVGIPINVGFLWLFHSGLHVHTLLAWLMAFECSALINFYANQRFTYRDQTHVRGVEWVWRSLRAQLSSISGVAINALVFALLLSSGLRYLEADAGGIVAAFACNFFIANRFVFTPASSVSASTLATTGGSGRAGLSRSPRTGQVGPVELTLDTGRDGDHARVVLGSLASVEEMA